MTNHEAAMELDAHPTRRPNQPLPDIPANHQENESSAKSSLRMGRGSSQMSSNNYEVLQTATSNSPTTSGQSNLRHDVDVSSPRHAREEAYKQKISADYKRTRSMGPLADSSNGPLEFSSPASSQSQRPRTAKSSRGNHQFDNHSPLDHRDHQHNNNNDRGRSRSKPKLVNARGQQASFDSPVSTSRGHPIMTRSHTTVEPRTPKHQSRKRSTERLSNGGQLLFSPPSPIEAQATLEKLLPRYTRKHYDIYCCQI